MLNSLPKPILNVEFMNGEDGHLYKLNGETTYFPGCTTILRLLSKPALVPWASKKASEHFRVWASNLKSIPTEKEINQEFEEAKRSPYAERDAAGARGTDVHSCIEEYLINQTKPTDPEIIPSFNNFLQWWDNSKWSLVAGDTPVICKSLEYGGRLDSVFKDENGDMVLVDFKTSKGIYTDMMFQLGAYRLALQETYGVTTKRMGILHIRPNKIEWHEAKAPDLCVMGFTMIKNLYDTIKQLEKLQSKETT